MENLDEALAALINTALSGIETSTEFLQAQLPDVIMQLLMWHGVKSGVFMVLGLGIIVLYLIAEVKVGKFAWEAEKRQGEYDPPVFWLGFLALGSLVRVPIYMVIATFVNLTWLQIWIAPKVWLLEYAASLVK